MAFAARLASKRKEAEEAGEDCDINEEKGLGKGGMSGLLQSKDGDDDEQPKNPFADDEDDDQSDDEEDEDDDGDLGRGESGGQSSSWNRGGWWRGALGSKKTPPKTETFGDGRDSESDQEDEGRGAGHSSDEEFGDFAMPESTGTSTEAGATAIDAEREKVLVKPLPVHPAGDKGGNKTGNFLGLWPFTKKDKDNSSGKEEEQAEKKDGGSEDASAAAETEKPIEAQAAEEVVKDGEEKQAAASAEAKNKTAGEEPPVVLSEDGKKVQPTVEAKRRTSIEEPDEGDEVVV